MPSIWIVATRAAKLCQECSMGRVRPNAGRNEPSDTYDRPAWRWVGGLTAGSMCWASWRSFSGGTGLAEGCPQVTLVLVLLALVLALLALVLVLLVSSSLLFSSCLSPSPLGCKSASMLKVLALRVSLLLVPSVCL